MLELLDLKKEKITAVNIKTESTDVRATRLQKQRESTALKTKPNQPM